MTFYSIAPGTTPTHVFSLPIGRGKVSALQITYSQNGIILVQKRLDDAEFFGHEVAVTLTQEETLRFENDTIIQIQVRFLDDEGNAYASNMINAKVNISNSFNVIRDDRFPEWIRYHKLDSYFYQIEFDHIDYEKGLAYFEKYKPEPSACSAVSFGNFFGRNFDYPYDDRASFLIYTKAELGRHAVMGVAKGTSLLTDSFVQSGVFSEDYNVVPFLLLDGINDAGLICEINVVPSDNGVTYGTNDHGIDMFSAMIPRYVLDYASTVDEAIALIRDRNIYCADNHGYSEEFHFMLADATKTAVVEFVQNEISVVDSFVGGRPIMTNLFLTGYDGTRGSLTAHAMGIERQGLLNDGYLGSGSESGMFDLMKSVWYSNAYMVKERPIWYSEFSGDWGEPWGDLTKDTPHDEYMPLIMSKVEEYKNRKRDGKTWHTVHTSIYNREEGSVSVTPQEGDRTYTFYLNKQD